MNYRQFLNFYHGSTFVLGILIGVGLTFVFHQNTVVVRQGTAENPAALSSANIMIDYGDGRVKTWNTVSWHEAMSVLGLTQEVADAKEIALSTAIGTGGNPTVGAIDGLTNDPKNNMRWQYWINNTYEPKISSKYYIKPGDIVLWKYLKEQDQSSVTSH